MAWCVAEESREEGSAACYLGKGIPAIGAATCNDSNVFCGRIENVTVNGHRFLIARIESDTALSIEARCSPEAK